MSVPSSVLETEKENVFRNGSIVLHLRKLGTNVVLVLRMDVCVCVCGGGGKCVEVR